MTPMVIIEHNNKELKHFNYNVLQAALQLQAEIEVVLVGFQCEALALTLSKVKGISKIHLFDHKNYAHCLAETYCEALISLDLSAINYFLAPASTFGKNLLPRLAAKLNSGQLSDVVEIINAQTFKRPIYAGNALETIKILKCDRPVCLTIRTSAFSNLSLDFSGNAEITQHHFVSEYQKSEFLALESHQGDRPELCNAEIIISGGRGLQNKETFERVIAIADRLGAAIGASRAAVDSGLAPNDFQVGQTGQIVAPKLYFALGISGAIQHLAGMKDSKIIVAINKDADAPIFQVANYGLVADLNDVLPEWEKTLTEMGY